MNFQEAEGDDGIYTRLWNRMVDNRQDSFLTNYEDGIERVRASNGISIISSINQLIQAPTDFSWKPPRMTI